MKEITIRVDKNVFPLQDLLHRFTLNRSVITGPFITYTHDGDVVVRTSHFEEVNLGWCVQVLHEDLRKRMKEHIPQ